MTDKCVVFQSVAQDTPMKWNSGKSKLLCVVERSLLYSLAQKADVSLPILCLSRVTSVGRIITAAFASNSLYRQKQNCVGHWRTP